MLATVNRVRDDEEAPKPISSEEIEDPRIKLTEFDAGTYED